MRISVIGAGYLGATQAVALAFRGYEVVGWRAAGWDLYALGRAVPHPTNGHPEPGLERGAA